jgi:hypothetical protein
MGICVMRSDYEYEIIEDKLVPPVGPFKFYAKVQFFYDWRTGKKVLVPLDLGEAHGCSADEARSKMQDRVDKWLQDNGYLD